MYGEWLRVTPAQLHLGQRDPQSLWALVEHAYATEFDLPEPDLTRRRWFGTEKVWSAFAYLLEPHAVPVSVVLGELPLLPLGAWAPCYLSPPQVQEAVAALSPLTVDALLAAVDPEAFRREEIYPHAWGSPEELRWVADVLPDVTTYFQAAATEGDAMLCWVS